MPERVNFNNKLYAMGWGIETDPINKRLIKERYYQSTVPANSIQELKKDEETPMEKLCRSMFEFDDGWCFHASEKLLYGEPLIHSQGNVGSCVGAGGGLALAAKASQEILNEGDPEDPYGWGTVDYSNADHCMPFTGYHYGCGRCKDLWDGTKFRGSINQGDGSYCSVQIWAYKTCGVLPCNLLLTNSRPYPQSTDVRLWGNNKQNLLNQHLTVGQQFLMQNNVVVNSSDDLLDTVTNLKHPCHICSGWGFKSAGYDNRYSITIYKRSGSWSHNMTIYGVINIKGTWFVVVKNSWGSDAHEEIGRGLPRGCFVITLDLFSSWIRQAVCMSIGELNLKSSIPEFV